MESNEEKSKKYQKRVEKFWENIETHINYDVPSYVKKIFEFSHLDNPIIVKGLTYEKLLTLQNAWNSEGYRAHAQSSTNPQEYFSSTYQKNKIYFFTLGVQQILKIILELVQTKPGAYWECDDDDSTLKMTLSQINTWNTQCKHVNETKYRKLSNSTLMNMLVSALAKNSGAKSKEGHRYEENLRLIAGYIYVLGGRILYENISSNLPLPSLSTASRVINETVKPIIQGECRVQELLDFLTKHGLPKIVWVSEDATRMVPKIQYDVKRNQVVGLVQPLDSRTGFPKIDCFQATSLAEIEKCFEGHTAASYLYCYMIQPLKIDAPSFCLNMFGTDSSFTTDDTTKRIDYITDLLEKNGIIVLGHSGDGDPRILKAMRINSQLGQSTVESEVQIDGFHACYSPKIISMQDPVHLATKFKTRLFKISITLPIGDYIVSASHIRFIIENITKEKHLLTSRHLDGKDKMNFESVIKICSKKVIELLRDQVPGSEATQEYLKIINFIIYSFLSTELSRSLRLYCIWYCTFFIRLWRKWLSKHDADYSINNNFLSLNTYLCLEINAHGFLSMLLKVIKDESLNDHFLPWMFSSQACEGFFRTWRSLSTVFCTAINSSVLEIMRKTQRLEFLSDVMAHDFGPETINFVRNTFMNPSFEKIKDTNVYLAENIVADDLFKKPLGIDTIKEILERAKHDSLSSITTLGIDNLTVRDAEELSVNPVEIKDESLFDEQDRDEAEEDCNVECDPEGSEEALEDEEVPESSDILANLDLKDYSTVKTDLKDDAPFLRIKQKDGSIKVVRKSSICYILSQNNDKLSSDRLIRVQGVAKTSRVDERRIITDVETLDNVRTLDWCLFENSTTGKCLVGFVLGFAYMGETKWKNIEFSKTVATVHSTDQTSEKKQIGVLCNWYGFFSQDKRVLIPAKLNTHGYHEIESYKCTIPTPIFQKNKILVSATVYKKIKGLVMNK